MHPTTNAHMHVGGTLDGLHIVVKKLVASRDFLTADIAERDPIFHH
jgi:hypothetical protein